MPFAMASLAQFYGAVAGEMASATAVVTYRPPGRFLVVLRAVVPGVGLLDVSVVTVASPTSTTTSLTTRVSTPPSPTTPISDERMGCWGGLAHPFLREIPLGLNQVDDLITVKNLFPTLLSKFEVVTFVGKGRNVFAKDCLSIYFDTSITHRLGEVF